MIRLMSNLTYDIQSLNTVDTAMVSWVEKSELQGLVN